MFERTPFEYDHGPWITSLLLRKIWHHSCVPLQKTSKRQFKAVGPNRAISTALSFERVPCLSALPLNMIMGLGLRRYCSEKYGIIRVFHCKKPPNVNSKRLGLIGPSPPPCHLNVCHV